MKNSSARWLSLSLSVESPGEDWIEAKMNTQTRLKVIRALLGIVILYTFGASFVLHWFFPDFYFIQLMGHAAYQDSMVKLIGLYGLMLSALAWFAIRNPIGNRDIVKVLIFGGVIMAGGFVYCIQFLDFPQSQYINVVALVLMSIIFAVIYPWHVRE